MAGASLLHASHDLESRQDAYVRCPCWVSRWLTGLNRRDLTSGDGRSSCCLEIRTDAGPSRQVQWVLSGGSYTVSSHRAVGRRCWQATNNVEGFLAVAAFPELCVPGVIDWVRVGV